LNSVSTLSRRIENGTIFDVKQIEQASPPNEVDKTGFKIMACRAANYNIDSLKNRRILLTIRKKNEIDRNSDICHDDGIA
jgi:hypothetical protein